MEGYRAKDLFAIDALSFSGKSVRRQYAKEDESLEIR
jgi:hypothetical protein